MGGIQTTDGFNKGSYGWKFIQVQAWISVPLRPEPVVQGIDQMRVRTD